MNVAEQLTGMLVRKGLFPEKGREKIAVSLSLGDINRHRDKLSKRYTVLYDGTPTHVVRSVPSNWSYAPKTILEAIAQYSTLKSVKVPKLLLHFRLEEGYYFVEEFLPDAVSLPELIERGEVTKAQGRDIMKKLFAELYKKGKKTTKKRIDAEKKEALLSLRKFFQPGLWSDILCDHVSKAVDKHASLLREVLTSGDIIDRNFIRSKGSWFLIDFEYGHRTVFFFMEAYRNKLYAPWTNEFSLAELYPPLGALPADVAAMLAIATERDFQAGLLDPQASEVTIKHLRYLLWNLIEPEILVRLDRRLQAIQEETAKADEESRRYKGLMEAREHDVAEKAEELRLRTSDVERSNEEINRVKEELNALEGSNREKSSRIERLEETGRQQDERIRTAQSEIGTLEEAKRRQAEEIVARDRQIAEREERLRKTLSEIERLENDLAALRKTLAEKNARLALDAAKIEELNTGIEQKSRRIREVETWGNEMLDLTKQKESTIVFQQKSIEELAAKERTLSSQLADKEAAYRQKSNEFIYIKSTLSYSVGRIITFPFELLFRGSMLIFGVIDKMAGKFLWPKGSMRAVIVNAFVHLKETIATGTYLLRMRGIGGLIGGIRQTWTAKANLGLHKNFSSPLPNSSAQTKPRHIQPLARSPLVEQTQAGVSVVIPVLNGADDLVKLLPVLNNQQGFKRIEVIVVDSGSTDDTVAIAEEYGAKIVKIPPEQFSHSGARNLGAEKATQEFLLFMTADALPVSETWLYEMYAFKKRKGVAAVSCMEVPRIDADLFTRVQQWFHYTHFLQLTDQDKVLSLPDSEDPVTLRKHGQLTDVACLTSRELFGTYKFRFEYGEDLDFGIRLIRDGYKIGLMNSTRVIHSHNRPPYYHLKRGYMDKQVLSRILNESLQTSGFDAIGLYADILSAHNALQNVTLTKLLGKKEFLQMKELRHEVDERVVSSAKHKLSGRVQIGPNEFVDPQFRSFLEKVAGYYNTNGKNHGSSHAILDGVNTFAGIALEYMDQTYDIVDETVVNDFIFLLYKDFASLCGVYTAISQCNGDDKALAELANELGDRAIMWEKNRPIPS